MRQILGFAAFLALGGVSVAVQARDVFVDNVAGDDRYGGQQARPSAGLHGPVATIGRALSVAQAGDRIIVANHGVPYHESISLVGSRHSGLELHDFVIQGNGAILDGSGPIPANAWEHYHKAVFRFRPERVAFQQLFLADRPVPRVIAPLLADAPPPLEPGQWCLQGGWIYFCVDPVKLPQDYALTYAKHSVGITLYHVRRVRIEDLIVQGFQLDGIHAANSAQDVRLLGVICRGNGRSGVAVGGASRVDIEACLIGNNGHAQVLTLPYSETWVRNSEILGNTAPAWVDQGGRLFLEGQEVRGGLEAIKSLSQVGSDPR